MSNVVKIWINLKREIRSSEIHPAHPDHSLTSQQHDLTFNITKILDLDYGDVVSKGEKRGT